MECEDADGVFDDMDAQLDKFSWDNDHAFLHFDAGGDLATPGKYKIPCITSKSAKVGRTRKGQTKQQDSNLASASTGRNRGKQLQSPEDELVSDEVWEMTMKEKLLQDAELYLRIIRYEVG